MMNPQITQRCTKCLLPNTYPGIVFDDQGVCNHCLNYKEEPLLGEELFLEKIRSKKGGEYDCIIGISGGKDSCYVAYLAKKVYGLRVIAYSYDFPFMVDLARKNAQTVCDSLGIELVVVRSKNNLEYNYLKNHLTSIAATGTTWGQCMFCHYGIAAILNQAALTYQAPFILSGVIRSEVWWNPGNRIHFLVNRIKGLPISEKLLFGYYQSKAYAKLVDQRFQFPIKGNSPLDVYSRARTPSNGPETIRVFDYLPWDRQLIEKTLREETGWQKPEKSHTWRYDCILEPLLDYTFYREYGISSTGLYLCGLIRSGEINREEAFQLMVRDENHTHLNESMKMVLDFLEIPQKIQEKYYANSFEETS